MTQPEDLIKDIVAELLELSSEPPAVMSMDVWEPYRSVMRRAAGWIQAAEELKKFDRPEAPRWEKS